MKPVVREFFAYREPPKINKLSVFSTLDSFDSPRLQLTHLVSTSYAIWPAMKTRHEQALVFVDLQKSETGTRWPVGLAFVQIADFAAQIPGREHNCSADSDLQGIQPSGEVPPGLGYHYRERWLTRRPDSLLRR